MPTSWLAAAAVLLCAAGTAGALVYVSRRKTARWAGRKVVLKWAEAPFGHVRPDGTFVAAGVLDTAVVEVTERRGAWLGVRHNGQSGWLAADAAIPVEDAPAYFGERLRADPGDVGAWTNRGIAHSQLGRLKQAVADFTQAIRLDPTAWQAYVCRANVWVTLMAFDRAAADVTEGIRLNPAWAGGYSNRGSVWFSAGDYDRAVADYTEAIRLDPTTPGTFYNRGSAWLRKQDFDRAVQDYDEAIRLDPTNPNYFYYRGDAWMGKHDFERALRDYDEAIRLGPAHTSYYAHRGRARAAQGEHERAEADFTAALRLEPANVEAFLGRGWARAELKRHAEALADFDEAARRAPANAWPWVSRACVWADETEKQYDRAKAALAEAMRLAPDDPVTLSAVAWFHAVCADAGCRDGKKAVEYALRACEKTGWKVTAMLEPLAAAYAEAGDFGQAVEYQRRVLDAPDVPKVKWAKVRERLKLYEQGEAYRE
jgi:tetratricopeptide (TPR) repeat protein